MKPRIFFLFKKAVVLLKKNKILLKNLKMNFDLPPSYDEEKNKVPPPSYTNGSNAVESFVEASPPPPPYDLHERPEEYCIKLQSWDVKSYYKSKKAKVTFVIGKRGSGKTSIVKYLLRCTKNKQKSFYFLVKSSKRDEYNGYILPEFVNANLTEFLIRFEQWIQKAKKNVNYTPHLNIIVDQLPILKREEQAKLLALINEARHFHCYWWFISNDYKKWMYHVADTILITPNGLRECSKSDFENLTFGPEYLTTISQAENNETLVFDITRDSSLPFHPLILMKDIYAQHEQSF